MVGSHVGKSAVAVALRAEPAPTYAECSDLFKNLWEGWSQENMHMTHFKLEVMILCQGVSKILTSNRISPIIFPSCHLIEEIRSFPTMYNTWGCLWGQIDETKHFLQKSGLKTLIFAVMVPDQLTSEWAGTNNFRGIANFHKCFGKFGTSASKWAMWKASIFKIVRLAATWKIFWSGHEKC